MFTFGREHEKACAVQYVKGERDILLAGKLTDTVHDLLEGQITTAELRKVLQEAFEAGGTGIWEQVANWLRRVGKEYPELLTLWPELSQHRSANVRFRVACCLPDMSPEMAKQVATMLLADTSKKVREMVSGKMHG